MDYLELLKEQLGSIFYLLVLCNSLYVGGFLNVVIYRLPIMIHHDFKSEASQYLGIATDDSERSKYLTFGGRSYCPACGHMIPFWHIIPVVSWLLLRGKASCCGAPFSFRYPMVEFLTGIGSLLLFIAFDPLTASFFTLAYWLLICVFFIDMDSYLIPDSLSYPLLWIGLVFNSTSVGLVSVENAILGVIGSYVVLQGFGYLWRSLKKKPFFMGGGDIKMILAATAWIGLTMLPFLLLISSVYTMIFFLVRANTGKYLSANKDKCHLIQYGPGLAVAFLSCLVFHEQLTLFLNLG